MIKRIIGLLSLILILMQGDSGGGLVADAKNISKFRPAAQKGPPRGNKNVAGKAFNGNYYSYRESNIAHTGRMRFPWLRVTFDKIEHVRALTMVVREAGWRQFLYTSRFYVGNQTNPELAKQDPHCGYDLTEAGFYDCDLWGAFFTMAKFTS